MEVRAVTTFICQECHADLDVTQTVCPRCGTPAPTSDPADNATNLQPASRQRMLDQPWFLVLVVLHVGVLGIPAYWATNYSLATRLMIIAVSILYTLVAVLIIIWGIRQIASLF